MKKVTLLFLCILGLIPVFDFTKKKISIYNNEIASQNTSSEVLRLIELKSYLEQQNPDKSYQIRGNQIFYNDVNDPQDYGFIRVSEYYNSPGFRSYLENKNIPPPPKQQKENDEDLDSNDDSEETSGDNSEFFEPIPDVPPISPEDIFTPIGGGNEPPPNEPPSCTSEYAEIKFEWDYYPVLVFRFEPNSPIFNQPSLPCGNKYLHGGYVFSFSNEQLQKIGGIEFDGGELVSVTYSNLSADKYEMASQFDALQQQINLESYNEEVCGSDRTLDTKIVYKNRASTLTFINFGKLQALSDPELNGLGISRNPGRLGSDNGPLIVTYRGIQENQADVSFTIDNANIVEAHVGDQVVSVYTRNGVKGFYCKTLTAEDIQLGFTRGRDPKYSLEEKGFDLEHTINVPQWVRDLLSWFDLPITDCMRDYANQGLAALHASPSYVNEPSETIKTVREIASVTYDLLFGMMYCATDEEAAKGKSCAAQIGLAVLHEAISSVDIAQIRDGVQKMAEGLDNFVSESVKDFRDGVKEVYEEYKNNDNKDYEGMAKDILERTLPDLNSVYDKAVEIANQFKEIYFTKCDEYQFKDGSTGDICCYKQGELATMILPIVLTAGNYAVVKLTALAAKYGPKVAKALSLINSAKNAGKIVSKEIDLVQDAEKLLIKESDGTIIASVKNEEEILEGTTTPNKVVVVTEKVKLFDEDAINNLTPETPNSLFINKSKFHTSAHKIDPDVDPFLKGKKDDIILNGDNLGGKTEEIMNHLYVNEGGYTVLDGKYGSNNGFDGLYIKGDVDNPSEIIIGEAKQWGANGGASVSAANASSGLPIQMSDAWVDYIADKLILTGDPNKIKIGNMLKNPANASLIKKNLIVLNKQTGDINILKLGAY